MSKFTIAIGALLIVIGVGAYIQSAAASLTALIPALVGVLILAAGIVSLNQKAHKHAIHAALGVALLGAAGSLTNVVKLGDLFAGTAERPAAVIVSTLLLIVTVVYLAVGIRSFIRARLRRSDARS